MAPVNQSPVVRFAREQSRRWPSRLLIVIGTVLAVLIAARIALPIVLQKQINQRLQKIPDYHGHVEDVDVSLLRGAYSMNGIVIRKLSG